MRQRTSERFKSGGQLVRRLNWGCGDSAAPGWINSDRIDAPGVNLRCDIRKGLPLPTNSVDYAVSIHALQEVPWPELMLVLKELRRVLKGGGVLRLCLPDLSKSLQELRRRNRRSFLVPDKDVRCLSGKFILHVLWYSHSRMMFTEEFIRELLFKAGFRKVARCGYRQTRSRYAGIVDLDNRPEESLFVEALK